MKEDITKFQKGLTQEIQDQFDNLNFTLVYKNKMYNRQEVLPGYGRWEEGPLDY